MKPPQAARPCPGTAAERRAARSSTSSAIRPASMARALSGWSTPTSPGRLAPPPLGEWRDPAQRLPAEAAARRRCGGPHGPAQPTRSLPARHDDRSASTHPPQGRAGHLCLFTSPMIARSGDRRLCSGSGALASHGRSVHVWPIICNLYCRYSCKNWCISKSLLHKIYFICPQICPQAGTAGGCCAGISCPIAT